MKHRTVLITRPREQSEELRRELEACGFQVLFFPTIQIAPPTSWEACDRALDRPPDYYDGVLFASANGAKGFMQRMRDRLIDPARFARWGVYAVGPKTAEELERAGLKVTLVPEDHNAAALAARLTEGDVQGRRFLFPRGNLGRDDIPRALEKAGALVETVSVYQTVAPDMTGTEALLRRIFQGEIDVVAFASPSAARNFAGIIPGGTLAQLCTRTTLAAIGPSTGETIRTLGGSDTIVAAISTARGMALAIQEHFGGHE